MQQQATGVHYLFKDKHCKNGILSTSGYRYLALQTRQGQSQCKKYHLPHK